MTKKTTYKNNNNDNNYFLLMRVNPKSKVNFLILQNKPWILKFKKSMYILLLNIFVTKNVNKLAKKSTISRER